MLAKASGGYRGPRLVKAVALSLLILLAGDLARRVTRGDGRMPWAVMAGPRIFLIETSRGVIRLTQITNPDGEPYALIEYDAAASTLMSMRWSGTKDVVSIDPGPAALRSSGYGFDRSTG
jgi:hypothetical protein